MSLRNRPAVQKVLERNAANGPTWTLLHLLSRGTEAASTWFEGRAREIERRRGLPGINSVERNRDIWGGYDWTNSGEEWTTSEAWRDAVVDAFVAPYLHEGAHVLEIGPGAGRWTVMLHAQAGKLQLADITETTLELCRTRLGDPPGVDYLLTDGESLAGVADASVDFLWSFDVFVHIAPAEQRRYAAEFARVLRPGAVAVIHHAGEGGLSGGWRSAMTGELFRTYAEDHGLEVVAQVERWGPHGEYVPSVEGDVVSVLRR